jgi:hypothetical protein
MWCVQEMGGATQDHAHQAGDMAGQKWEEGKQGAAETKDQSGNKLQQVPTHSINLLSIFAIRSISQVTSMHHCFGSSSLLNCNM